MSNRDIQAAWRYHNQTKHSWHSVHTSALRLDWNNEPLPFKIYPHLEADKLPTDLPASGVPALSALAGGASEEATTAPTRRHLAGLLYYAAGITKKGIVPGGQVYFRAAACTGALFHIELYLVCGDLPGVSAGVYHFSPHDFSLRRLRAGDYRGLLVEATGGEPAVAQAPALLVTTSVYWRNAWKYQSRAYRHAYWDSGTILANLLAMGDAYRIPLKVVTAFVDAPVNHLLGLDDRREAALQIVPVGKVSEQAPPPPPEAAPLDLEVTPYSRREMDYPLMREMHDASSLDAPEEVRELRGHPPLLPDPPPQGQLFPLAIAPEADLPPDSIEDTIQRRGSSRRFRRLPITYSQLSVMLERATRGLDADFLEGRDTTLNQLYLIVNDVDGLPPGSYVFRRQQRALEQLQAGDFREQAGHLDLGQPLAADASVNVYFLADLNSVLERYGNRGYRMAQVEASIMGGRLYLGAYAQRLGATGLTFFDDDVTEFFSPHAQGKSVMFLVALGRPQPRRRRG